MSERTPVNLAQTMFTSRYASKYDEYSALSRARYEDPMRVLAGLEGGIQNGDRVVELGPGTGNSTIVLAESNPRFSTLLGVDISRGFLEFAGYKFGMTPETPLLGDSSTVTTDYIEEMKRRALPFADGRVQFVEARAESLPVKSGTIDKVYANQVIHWLAFADNDQEGADVSYLDISLREVGRILKPGGKFIFNTSGQQFDSGDKTHVLTHPFHLKFIELLNSIYKDMLIPNDQLIDPNKINRYHNMLNLALVQERLKTAGFSIVPIEGKPYETTTIPQTTQDMMDFIRGGAAMRYFDAPALRDLNDATRTMLVENALIITKIKHPRLLTTPSNELIASFVAQKSQS